MTCCGEKVKHLHNTTATLECGAVLVSEVNECGVCKKRCARPLYRHEPAAGNGKRQVTQLASKDD